MHLVPQGTHVVVVDEFSLRKWEDAYILFLKLLFLLKGKKRIEITDHVQQHIFLKRSCLVD